MVYNLSGMQNASSLMDMAVGTNVIFGGYVFGPFVLFIICFVTFITLKTKGYAAPACFATAMWLTTLVNLLLKPMGLIGNKSFWSVIILMCISTVLLFLSGNVD